MFTFALKHLFICLIFLLLTASGIAQDANKVQSPYKIGFRFSPLGFMDINPALKVGMEAKTFHGQAIVLDFGYPFTLGIGNKSSGYKFAAEYRFYRARRPSYERMDFWAIQYFRKKISKDYNLGIVMANNTVPFIDTQKIYETNAAYLLYGRLLPVGDNLKAELLLGLGARKIDIGFKDVSADSIFFNPNDDDASRFITLLSLPGSYLRPGMICTARLVWFID